MSAIRTSHRTSRSSRTPYSRPPTKKSSWSIGGFLKSLVSWSSVDTLEEDDASIEEEVQNVPSSPAASLRDRGHQIEREINTSRTVLQAPPPESRQPTASSTLFDSNSPPKDLETVSAQLRGSLDRSEVERLCTMLQGSLPETEPEPFRFSATPATPTRGASPYQGDSNGFVFGVSSSSPAPTPSPRKILNRNPNGVYRWQGGGSARASRSKNRYSSPAFGPSQSTSDRLILRDTQVGIETPGSDTKRRKVADELNSSSMASSSTSHSGAVPKPVVRATAPDPSPTRVRQALPFPVSSGSPVTPRAPGSASSSNVNSSPSISRLRAAPLPQKPTIPVVPSPLRQAWSGGSSPSQSDNIPATSSSPKQTKAANYMTELIKEVTPPKRPDLSNPYQIASPLGKVGSAPKGRVGKRVRATGKPAAPVSKEEKGKEKDEKASENEKSYTPQAIIEATLPKGSKRSRPPTRIEKPLPTDREPSPEQQLQSRDKRRAYFGEETSDDDEDAKRTAKKSKSHLGGRGVPASVRNSKSSAPEIFIQEVKDTDPVITSDKPQPVASLPQASGSASTTLLGRSAFSGFKAASAPKEPSKLRFSYQPEITNSPAPAPLASLPASSVSSFISTAAPTSHPVSSPFSSSAPQSPAFPSMPASTPLSAASTDTSVNDCRNTSPSVAQEAALKVARSSLPTFKLSLTVQVLLTDSEHVEARTKAMSMTKSSLPQFDFSKGMSGLSAKASKSAIPVSAPIVPFDWAGFGAKAPSDSTTWTCSLCMLTNPMSATEQCEHCETKRPTSTAPITTSTAPTTTPAAIKAPAVQGFNWAAAGVKPPTAGDGWTCSLCGLSNPASATKQCDTCESPRP